MNALRELWNDLRAGVLGHRLPKFLLIVVALLAVALLWEWLSP